MIELKAIDKTLGRKLILSNVSLSVRPGEIVGIAGQVGAGKSTLLKILTRETAPTSGKIVIGEQDVSKIKSRNIPKYRQKIGFVFQDFKLLDDRTVYENVALALEVRGLNDSEIAKQVEHTLKLVEIWNRRNLFPKQLSGVLQF